MLGSFVSDAVAWAHSTQRQPLNTLCTHSTARSAHLSLCWCCSLPTTLAVYSTHHRTQYCCCWLLCAATLCSSHRTLTSCVSTHSAIYRKQASRCCAAVCVLCCCYPGHLLERLSFLIVLFLLSARARRWAPSASISLSGAHSAASANSRTGQYTAHALERSASVS